MNAVKVSKDPKKLSQSPLKTPEKALTNRKPPSLKKSAVKTKPITISKKTVHTKSFSQINVFEELKQNSLNFIEGVEKLRRIVAFSKYRPCFETIKSVFYSEKTQISQFHRLKTLYKAWEGLQSSKNYQELYEIIDRYREILYEQEHISSKFYNKALMGKAFNAIIHNFCQNSEMNSVLDEFYKRKIMRKSFTLLCKTSKIDYIIEDFVRVTII